MRKGAAVSGRKQEEAPVAMSMAMQQLMLPLLLAMDATKKGLLAFVQQMGMVALSELLATEAAMIAGPKGQHVDGRTHHHWGAATTRVGFGGRNVSLTYPRVRARGKGSGKEVVLPSLEALRDGDPMTDRVAEQIALGVSTRGYAKSQKGFRRVKGYVHMPSLVAALRPAAGTVASDRRSRKNLIEPPRLPEVQQATARSPPRPESSHEGPILAVPPSRIVAWMLGRV